jgi:hypothetical protein
MCCLSQYSHCMCACVCVCVRAYPQIPPNTDALNPSNPMICDGTIKSSSVQLSCGTGVPTASPEASTASAAAPSSSISPSSLSLSSSQRGVAVDVRTGNDDDGQPSCLSATPMDFDTTKGYYERHGWKVGLSACPAAGTPPASSSIFHMSGAGELRVGNGCLSSVPLNGPQLWTKPLEIGSDAGE